MDSGLARSEQLDRNSDNKSNSAQFQLKWPAGTDIGNTKYGSADRFIFLTINIYILS